MSRARDLADSADNNLDSIVADSSGNVGIGATNPNAKLHIVSGVDTNAASGTGAVRIQGGASTYSGYLGFDSSTMSIGTNNAARGLSFAAGGAERMRIDSSGNVLVGTTDATPYNNSAGSSADKGICLGNGFISAANYSSSAADLNRTGTDGNIVNFYKDGTTVGSIGVNTDLIIDGASGESGLKFGNTALVPRFNGADNDTNVSLGLSTRRFSNLYLSGGVYVGGTGSANYLDDYEEGEFTVTMTPSTSGSITQHTAYVTLTYTKIGRAVTITGNLVTTGISSAVGTYVNIGSLPFVNGNGTQTSHAAGTCFAYNQGGGVWGEAKVRLNEGSSTINWYVDASTLTGTKELYINLTYFTS